MGASRLVAGRLPAKHLAGIWEKKNLEFRLVPEDLRIAEPPTYADIRKD